MGWTPTSLSDSDAIHDNVAGEIAAVTEKVTPVDADLILIEDSADSNNKKRAQVGNLPGGSGAGTWQDFTPTITATTTDPTIGNGTLVGRYTQIGKLIVAHVRFVFGSTSNAGSGTWEITVPVAPNGTTYAGNDANLGTVNVLDSGTAQWSGHFRWVASSSAGRLIIHDHTAGTSAVRHDSPMTWATGDEFAYTITYEAA